MLRPTTASSLLVLSLCAWASAASADEPSAPAASSAEAGDAARAAELKKKGDDAMVSLQYRDALDAYNEAYRITADPALLYNRGRAHQALTEYPQALDMFEQFASTAPPELKARVPLLDRLIADVRARVSVLDVRTNVPAAVVLVRDRIERARPIRVRAGPAKIEVRADGYTPWTRSVDLPGGVTTSLDAVLRPVLPSGIGTITVLTTPAAALVTIDGRPLGSAPVEAQVRAGSHAVVLQRDGYDTWRAAVAVDSGERRRLDATLAKTPPITQKWWFWTGIGVVVAGGVAVAIAATSTRDAPSGTIAPGQVRGP